MPHYVNQCLHEFVIDKKLKKNMFHNTIPGKKMTIFCAIFDVNSSIGKFWDKLVYFDKKDTVFLLIEQNSGLLFDKSAKKSPGIQQTV